MVEVDDVVERLRQDQRIELVQVNHVFEGIQGHIADDYLGLSYGPKQIHADVVQAKVTGKGIDIAVIDTGADKEHVDLKGHIGATENFVDGGNASFDTDKTWHRRFWHHRGHCRQWHGHQRHRAGCQGKCL